MTAEHKRSTVQFFEKKGKATLLLQWCGLSHSTYYYHPHSGKQGRKPSTQTLLNDGSTISNESVVICIRFVLAEEFMLFTGYVKITRDLQSYGFVINKKKVYRLMKEHQLLCGVVIRTRGEKRQFVSYRVQEPVRPMEQLCMDIKYVYIHGERRNALLLTWTSTAAVFWHRCCGGVSEKSRSFGCCIVCCSSTRPRVLPYATTTAHSSFPVQFGTICRKEK